MLPLFRIMKGVGFILLLSSLLFVACQQAEETFSQQAPHNKYILCRGTALYLNNGQKWPANKETTEGIDMMLRQIQSFETPADTTAYHVLGDSLMSDYLYIINYCVDMGPAHEMIHSYLFPIHEIIVPMQLGGQATCEAQYVKLTDYLGRYHEYFE